MNKTRRSGVLFCILVFTLTASSCLGINFEKDTESKRASCPMEDLLISVSDLTGDQWYESGSRSYRDAPMNLGVDRIGTGFSTDRNGNAEENVYVFKDESDAMDGFSIIYDSWGNLVLPDAVWSPLDFPFEEKIHADEFRLDCSTEGENQIRTCWFLARYKKTVVEFLATMIVMTDNKFMDLIQIIDSKVQKCEDEQ